MFRKYGYRFCGRKARNFYSRAGDSGATGEASGQENRHHGEDEDDRGGAVFYQLEEALIGLLMSLIIIAVIGRVRHFVRLWHPFPPAMLAARGELPQS